MQQLTRVYAQRVMRVRLLISVLVLALSGANSGATAICAAFCGSFASARSAVVHHHRMESNSQLSPTSVSRHIHARHQGAPCAECPPASHYGLIQNADCTNLVQIQALKESSFSLEAPHSVTQIDFVDAPNADLSLAANHERPLVFDTSQALRRSNPSSVPLRI